MNVRSLLVPVGFLLAAIGNAGWALVVQGYQAEWWFWSLSVGATLCAVAAFLSPQRRALLSAVGWTLAAYGGLRLLFPISVGPDFVALLFYTLGPLTAAAGNLVMDVRTGRHQSRIVVVGAAMTGFGGLYWVGLDVAHNSLNETWANAAIGVGYALAAWGLAWTLNPARRPT